MEKNLGHATAYGYAKSKGYSGTEEEFAELMADYASVGQSAAQSAEQAAASATSASGSATTASQAAQTATDKASEAVTAAGTATTKASEASTSADTASAAATSAGTSAQTATAKAGTATAKADEAAASEAAALSAKTDAESARDAAAQSASQAAESARTLTIDATLTQSGQAADAKATGDAVTELKNDLNATSSIVGDALGTYKSESITIKPGSTKKKILQFDCPANKQITLTIKRESATNIDTYVYVCAEDGSNIWASSAKFPASDTEFTRTFTVATAYENAQVLYTVAANASDDILITDANISVEGGGEIGDVVASVQSLKYYLNLSKTRNLLNIANPDSLNGVSLSIDNTGITLTATTSGTYRYALYVIDVRDINALTVSYKSFSGTGSGSIRVGHNDNGDASSITWDDYVTTNPKRFNVSSYSYVIIALYAVVNTNVGIGNYITYSEVQVEAGNVQTEYIPHQVPTDQIARLEIGRISEKTKNLVSFELEDWDGINASVSTTSKDITVTALTAGTYRYALQRIDVSDLTAVTVSWSATTGDGVGKVRVGNGDASAITWISLAEASGTTYDVSDINSLAIGLYASVGTSLPENTYNIFSELQVEAGNTATDFIEPYTAIDHVARQAAGVDTIPFPSYYNNTGYLDDKIADAKALIQSCAGNGDAFIFITDEHYDGWNQKHSPSLIKYISENLHISKLFDGGDNYNGANDEFANALRRSFDGEIHHVTGNHECFYLTDGNKLAYQYDMYNDNQIGNTTERYYYVDDAQRKIRYIVLSAYTATSASEGNADFNFTQEQIEWVTGTALNVESGWTIIIFTHALYVINLTTNVCSVPSALVPMVTAIDAYNGNGKIACIIQGHTHRDRITSTPNGIPVIITTCDKNKVWTNSQDVDDIDVTRTSGTIAEQAFDIIVLDKKNQKVTALRIGAPARNGIGNDPGSEVQVREVSYN